MKPSSEKKILIFTESLDFGYSPSGKATEFDSVMHRFESCMPSSVDWFSLKI